MVKAKTGGDCMQNPSDLDATYNAHKGQGYQAQIAETCSPENEVQLITGALPQSAAEPDGGAVVPMLDQLTESKLLPETMLADTLYGGDENVQAAETRGVELAAPIPGCEPEIDPAALTLDDFAVERTGRVEAWDRAAVVGGAWGRGAWGGGDGVGQGSGGHGVGMGGAWGQTEFQVNLKLGLTPRSADPAGAHTLSSLRRETRYSESQNGRKR